MKGAYYNEFDPYTAQWLRNLVAGGHIAPGDVDERSIVDVSPDDLCGYAQCHFFAGIGGWSYALRLAGWPDDRPVWTGSCPCQPFSTAGQRRGSADARHLWPEFYRLIAKCAPSIVFGEQVAGPLGRAWLAGVCADMEELGYAVGAADLCAAGVAAPHIRQRIYWMADAERIGLEGSSREEAVWQALPAPWASSVAVVCNGGERKRLPPEPGLFPLVERVPKRMERVRAAGNAIVPQIAAHFIRAAGLSVAKFATSC